MSDNLYEIDNAMNLIKEEIIRELYESVSRQNTDNYNQEFSTANISLTEKTKD